MNEISLRASASGTHGDRYDLTTGTIELGGWIIWDSSIQEYVKDGTKTWRSFDVEQARGVHEALNRSDRDGTQYFLPPAAESAPKGTSGVARVCVQHDQVEPGMTIKLANHGPQGRWVRIVQVMELRPKTSQQEASALVGATYLNSSTPTREFRVVLYSREDGYEVHPQNKLLAAKAHQRTGRADVKNVILRDYSIKFVAVDRVDNQGETCGYCTCNPIRCNIYATCTTDSGHTEENTWSTCENCTLHSIDQVEDVDPSYTIMIERAQR